MTPAKYASMPWPCAECLKLAKYQMDWDDKQFLPVLMEEVGEVANCLTYDGPIFNLRHELIQVAAVACTWADAVERYLQAYPCSHYRRGPIQPDDSQQCLDCGIVMVSDG